MRFSKISQEQRESDLFSLKKMQAICGLLIMREEIQEFCKVLSKIVGRFLLDIALSTSIVILFLEPNNS